MREGGRVGIGFGALFGQGSEKVSVAGFAGAGLTWKDGGERAGFNGDCVGCRPIRKAFEGGLDSGEVVEGIEAVGAASKFTEGLGATEHEEAKDGGLVAAEVENCADAVLVLGHAGGGGREADRRDEGEIFERVKGLANLFFGEIEDRVAAGALIARIEEGVQGERIIFGRGDLFFDEGAEDAELDLV
jgi:hypothetical protein